MKRVEWIVLLIVALSIGGRLSTAQARGSSKRVAGRTELVLDRSAAILVDPAEPPAVSLAADDLAADLEKILGSRPAIVHSPADAAPVTILIGGTKSPVVSGVRAVPISQPESFSISAETAHWAHRAPTRIVMLAGADMRGTMYAVYQFSQEFLGVDPMYYWTDHEPAKRDRIEIPMSLRETYPSPVFANRGFFINDEDLLTGWAPGEEKDHTGISLEVWNRIFETILRLKGDMVIPGSWIFPDEPQVKLASRRGLIIAQHHATPLGLNAVRWPQNVPYSYTEHPEILQRAWRNAVARYDPDQDVLWTVGLRGLSDQSYAAVDRTVQGDDRKLGAAITGAIADEMRIVRAARPHARFILNLWQEGTRLQKEGYLKIPDDVTTVWADTGYGYLPDRGAVAEGQGAYYHVAMYNLYANQLTEMVPVERIEAELGRYIRANATRYLLVNTSDIRPVAMTAKAVMDIGWRGLQDDESDGADYYGRWSAEEFGEKAAPDVAQIYRDYFHAPANRPGAEPELPYGDTYYHTVARQLLLAAMVGSPLYGIPAQKPTWTDPAVLPLGRGDPSRWMRHTAKGEVERCDAAQPRWDRLWEKAVAAEALVPADRKPFYEADVLAMIAINKESNRMLSLTARAVSDASDGRTPDARRETEQALASFDRIDSAEAAAEYGQWKNWYRGDWLTGIYRTRERLRQFRAYLDDPLGHIATPIFWEQWEAYYHIMHYEGSRTVDVR